MANPCMFYGIPCEAGTEGNCVCRKRFFASTPRPDNYEETEASRTEVELGSTDSGDEKHGA